MTHKRENHVDFDEILKHIGQFGRWQICIFFLLWLTSAAGGLAVVVWAFTGFNIKHRCPVSYCDGPDSSYWSDSNMTEVPAFALNTTNSCGVYNINPSSNIDTSTITCERYTEMIQTNDSNLVMDRCSHEDLIFSNKFVMDSVVTEYHFTCDHSYLRSIYGALYMLGMLVGSFFFGLISDHFGRMKALMLSTLFAGVGGLLGAFMPAAAGYGFFRFITGMGGMGLFMVTFVLAVEYVGFKFTMLVGIAIEIPFAIGELILGWEAYYIRDWYTLQLVAYTPILLFLVLWFLIPESPRWLLAMDRVEEAEKIIRKGAKMNKREFPQHLFKEGTTANGHFDMAHEDQRKPNILDLFRPFPIFLRSTNMMYQWFSVTLAYYGLSFASTGLGDDPYMNFMLSVFIEIPGYFFCIFVMDCWGRRPILSFCQLVSGVCCIGAGLLQGVEHLVGLQIFLSLVGKFMASATFAIVYVYTAELFPTVIRNTAIGSCSTIARVGGIVSLLLGLIPVMWAMIIMGIVACVAGILAFFFPETVGNKLPETMNEAIDIGKHTNRGFCTCICVNVKKQYFSDEEM